MIINTKTASGVIGMIGTNYNKKRTLSSILNITFNKYDFMSLFIAYLKQEGEAMIDSETLADDLYSFAYCGFDILFSDIKKETKEESILELQTAVAYAKERNLLSEEENTKSFILMNEKQKEMTIKKYDLAICVQMEKLVKQYRKHIKIREQIAQDFLDEPEENRKLSRCLKIKKDLIITEEMQEMLRKDFENDE